MRDVIGHKVSVLWNIIICYCDFQIFRFLVKYDKTLYCETLKLHITEPSQVMSDSMRDDPSVIKVRGLPYDTSPIDLCGFFKDCEINGGPNGKNKPMSYQVSIIIRM